MQKLLIKGKKELKGNIYISGSKNATLPILAASILANTTKLKNVPLVKDIFNFKYDDFELVDYDPYPLIKAPVAI